MYSDTHSQEIESVERSNSYEKLRFSVITLSAFTQQSNLEMEQKLDKLGMASAP